MTPVTTGFTNIDREQLATILREHSELPWSGVLSSEATAALHLDAWTARNAQAIVGDRAQHLAAIVLEELEWDTKLLGIKCARVTPIASPLRRPENFMQADREMIAELVAELRERNIQLADCKISTTDLFLVRAFEEAGFHMVDMLVTMSMDAGRIREAITRHQARIEVLSELETRIDGKVIVRPLQVRDLPSMLKLALEAFSDTAEIKDRFFLEPSIDHARACDLFQEWFRNAVRKQQSSEGEVLIAELDGEACGFVTMNGPTKETGYWQDSLNAILPEARGKGIFRALVLGSIHYVAMRNGALLTRTQISTKRVINTWLHTGADLSESFFTLHFTP